MLVPVAVQDTATGSVLLLCLYEGCRCIAAIVVGCVDILVCSALYYLRMLLRSALSGPRQELIPSVSRPDIVQCHHNWRVSFMFIFCYWYRGCAKRQSGT